MKMKIKYANIWKLSIAVVVGFDNRKCTATKIVDYFTCNW